MIYIKIEFLGGAGEVGKSAIKFGDMMLDYGVKLDEEVPEYPAYRKVDAILLSHAHLDHCGAVPVLFKNHEPKFITTPATADLYDVMIKDSLKVGMLSDLPVPFRKSHINRSLRNLVKFEFNDPFFLHGFRISFLEAGHIPGAAGILLEKHGKRLFYTGDTNALPTYLTRPAVYPAKVDYLIIESTYSDKDHPDRKEEEERFKEAIMEGLRNGEKIIIPAFALGRAQEVVMILYNLGFRDMYLDGMAKKISEIILYHSNYIRDPGMLERALDHTILIEGGKHREEAIERGEIFVTTAGMMTGGPVIEYMKELYNRPSRVLFTGFLVENTPGRRLLETGIFSNEEFAVKYENPVMKFDFSAHSGRSQLISAIRQMNPKKVFLVHGEKTDEFADELAEMGFDAESPKVGDEFEIPI